MTNDSVKKIPRSVITHNGPFHADDVCACALLLYFDQIDQDKIHRKRLKKLEEYASYEYVCDMSGYYDTKKKFFDHHQIEYEGDKSSAGLILAYLEEQNIIDHPLKEYLDNTFIKGVDAIDNGLITPIVGHCSFSAVVESFMPLDQTISDQETNKRFMEALRFTKDFISRIVDKHKYLLGIKKKIKVVMKSGLENKSDYLIFDEPLPWVDLFFTIEKEICQGLHPSKLLIMPAGNNYKVRAIPPDGQHKMDKRLSHPKSWCGLLGDVLEEASGVKGAIFCHKNGFLSLWKTKLAAIEAANLILQEMK